MSETIDIPTSDSAASLFHIIGASEVIAEEPVFTIVGAHEEESAMPGAVLAEPDSASESLVHSAGLFGVTGAGSPLKSSAMPLALRVMR